MWQPHYSWPLVLQRLVLLRRRWRRWEEQRWPIEWRKRRCEAAWRWLSEMRRRGWEVNEAAKRERRERRRGSRSEAASTEERVAKRPWAQPWAEARLTWAPQAWSAVAVPVLLTAPQCSAGKSRRLARARSETPRLLSLPQ